MGDWAHGLLGCFDDFGTCIIAWFVPCVTFGQNAEAAGTASSCLIGGIFFLIPLLNIICWIQTRGAIREQHGIEGSLVSDILAIFCCPLCALVQEAQQVKSGPGGGVARS